MKQYQIIQVYRMFEIFQRCVLNLFSKQMRYLGQCIFLTPCFNCQYWDSCFILDYCSLQECTVDPLPSQTELYVWRNHCDFKISQKECKREIRIVKKYKGARRRFLTVFFHSGCSWVYTQRIHSIYKILSWKITEFLQTLYGKKDTKLVLLYII